jgi:predicted DsbA family dithiol-disulfide isomerase
MHLRGMYRTLSGYTLLLALTACGQPEAGSVASPDAVRMDRSPTNAMTIEIWSDVVCPFCYIGKRELERALAQFEHADQVQVTWRSFELDPDAPARSEHDMYGMLVSKYGGTREDAKARVDGVVQRARSVGLDYHMDKAVIGSSFDAHRLLQLAKTKGLGDAMKERLFRAYFTEGAHLADRPTLIRLGSEVGLDGAEVAQVLSTSAFTDAVRKDEQDARRVGVRGVPFFLVDGKYSVSGAQPSEVFLGALRKAWGER